MAFKVLLAQNVAQAGITLLKEHGYEVVQAPEENREGMKEWISDCDAVFSKTFFLDEEILRAGKKLKVVAKHGVGIDNVVSLDTATKLGLYVVNTPLANMESVAEHTIAGMLAFSERIIAMDAATRAADFEAPERGGLNEIGGKTIGIIGLGNIGKSVARKALAFNMHVLGYDPYVKREALPEQVELVSDVNEIYRRADYITLHLGATPETINMVTEAQFAMMKPSAVFINYARGSLVKEQDLVEALRSRRIRGAVLDVYRDEPPAADNPLLHMENVLLSPHSAALTEEALDRMSYQGAQGIVEVLSGQRPTWCPNYDRVTKQ